LRRRNPSPNFFVAGAIADEENLALRDSRYAAPSRKMISLAKRCACVSRPASAERVSRYRFALAKRYVTPRAQTRDAGTPLRNRDHFSTGGGIPGIARARFFFVSDRTSHKEIWEMDYDGANQRALTNTRHHFAVA